MINQCEYESPVEIWIWGKGVFLINVEGFLGGLFLVNTYYNLIQ